MISDKEHKADVMRREHDTSHIPLKQDQESSQIVLRDDGEQRFRAAVRAAAKSGPMHRPSKS